MALLWGEMELLWHCHNGKRIRLRRRDHRKEESSCKRGERTVQVGSLDGTLVLAPIRKTSCAYTQNIVWLYAKFKDLENQCVIIVKSQ